MENLLGPAVEGPQVHYQAREVSRQLSWADCCQKYSNCDKECHVRRIYNLVDYIHRNEKNRFKTLSVQKQDGIYKYLMGSTWAEKQLQQVGGIIELHFVSFIPRELPSLESLIISDQLNNRLKHRRVGTTCQFYLEILIFYQYSQNSHLVSCVFKQDNPVNGEIMQERESYMFYLDNI